MICLDGLGHDDVHDGDDAKDDDSGDGVGNLNGDRDHSHVLDNDDVGDDVNDIGDDHVGHVHIDGDNVDDVVVGGYHIDGGDVNDNDVDNGDGGNRSDI